MNTPFTRLLAGALLLIALSAGGFFVSRFVGAGEGHVKFDYADGLLTTNRSILSLCVDGAGGNAVSPNAVDSVGRALENVLFDTSNVPPGYANWEVTSGCPPPSGLTGTPTDRWERNSGAGSGVFVGSEGAPLTPSEHRTFVYFVAPGAYAASFGDEPYANISEEFLCERGFCSGVTIGIYLPNTVTSAVLRQALLEALNLLPPEPRPTIDWGPCERGEPSEIDCRRYDERPR